MRPWQPVTGPRRSGTTRDGGLPSVSSGCSSATRPMTSRPASLLMLGVTWPLSRPCSPRQPSALALARPARAPSMLAQPRQVAQERNVDLAVVPVERLGVGPRLVEGEEASRHRAGIRYHSGTGGISRTASSVSSRTSAGRSAASNARTYRWITARTSGSSGSMISPASFTSARAARARCNPLLTAVTVVPSCAATSALNWSTSRSSYTVYLNR